MEQPPPPNVPATATGAVRPPPDQLRLGPSAASRCRRRIHLDAAHPEQRSAPSAAATRALDELTEHRDRVLATIRAANVGPGASAGTATSGPPGDTDQWLVQPQAVVFRPNMTVGHRSGSADLLVWAGDGYVPVIVRAHRTRDAGFGAPCAPLTEPLLLRADPVHRARRHRSDRLALAHHYRQLVELGCASRTASGGVIGRGSPTDGAGRQETIGSEDDAAVIVWHDLDSAGSSVLADYDLRFNDRVAVALAAREGTEPLAWPSRVAECRRCHWWGRCAAELQAAQDISLLLAGDDVGVARAAGIDSIPQLADLPREVLAALSLTLASPGLTQVRARAWQQKLPLVRLNDRATVRRADVELDVDAESYGEDGAYLWGAALSGADIGLPAGYRSFVTWDSLPSPAQGAVFGDFFSYVMQVREAAAARGLSFAVFCYAKAAEERWMLGLARRYAGLPGVPAVGQVLGFCRSPQWIDLMQEVKRQFVLPGSLRLKDVATSVGFSWRDPEPGGENSMAWYRAAVGLEAGVGATAMAQRVLRYNEDDVLATLAVRRWIGEHLAELPTVADLESREA